jgi:hypothetical protein
MSAKTKARQVIAGAEEATREAARIAEVRAENPPLHPDEDGPIEEGPHAGHYTHWTPAHIVDMCSCGAVMGVAAIALTEDDPPPPEICEICEARGITYH